MKLGIQPGYRVSFVNEPKHYRSLLGELPDGIQVLGNRATKVDFIHLFAADHRQLTQSLPRARKRIKPSGMIWVSWPKLSSPLKGDLNENRIREFGLGHGLVDVKIAAIDMDWSGLKFVIPVKDRPSEG